MTGSVKNLLIYQTAGGAIAAAIMLFLLWLFPGMSPHTAKYVGIAIVFLMCAFLLLHRLWWGPSALTRGVPGVRIRGVRISVRREPRL
jgi:sorbitol-specific phosphotransferase system component IIBC